MSATITLAIDPADWMSSNRRLHWAQRAKRTKTIRHLAFVTARAARVPRHGPTSVAAFIGYPTNAKADPANANPVVKAAIDGLTDAHVWPDDDSEHVVSTSFARDPKTTDGTYSVRLVLTDQEVPF